MITIDEVLSGSTKCESDAKLLLKASDNHEEWAEKSEFDLSFKKQFF